MLILKMTQFDTAYNSLFKKLNIEYQAITIFVSRNIQIPSSTQALTQLIIIQLVGLIVF